MLKQYNNIKILSQQLIKSFWDPMLKLEGCTKNHQSSVGLPKKNLACLCFADMAGVQGAIYLSKTLESCNLSKLNGKEVASLTGFKSLMMEDIPSYERHICVFFKRCLRVSFSCCYPGNAIIVFPWIVDGQ